MKRVLQIALLFVCFLGYTQETQEVYQRAQINYNSIEDLSKLDALGIPVDHGIHKRGFFYYFRFFEIRD
jgi:hypothetical protein